MSSESPRKRTRVDAFSSDPSNWIRHPVLYISDGSILLCENTLFRISGGTLALNSEVFEDMFSLGPNQLPDAESYDGVPLVRLDDSAVFLKAIFVFE